MNKTFYGYTHQRNGSIVVIHIFIILKPKGCKVNNDSATCLWHYCLSHNGVKGIKKLHADGILESLDYESLDACEPCLMGKMTKTSFSGTMLRATDLWKSYILMYVVR